ncbi:MAG TPA: hypothetical protein PKE16_18685 [Hyphomicrobium sp.]|nr:hypothetical protein [Hyphomicrobium sp.]
MLERARDHLTRGLRDVERSRRGEEQHTPKKLAVRLSVDKRILKFRARKGAHYAAQGVPVGIDGHRLVKRELLGGRKMG